VELDRRLRKDETGRFEALAAGGPDLDIVVWKMKAVTPEQSSALAQKLFAACAARDLHLALVELPLRWFQTADGTESDATVTCLRSVLMKPEHEAWLDEIWERLTAARAEILGEK